AADLQAEGAQGVVTNAQYDTWWHGGFRTAPYYHNSVGILSEAASARLMTPVEIKPEQLARTSTRGLPSALQPATNFPDPWPGGAWRPRDIMEMELIASRSVLSLAAKYRERYLRNFYRLGRRALDWRAGDGRAVAYLIPPGQGRDEAVARMVSLLVEQGVEVHRLERELHGFVTEPLHQYSAAGDRRTTNSHGGHGDARTPSEQELPAGSYVVMLVQPYRANVQALFERQVYPDRRTGTGEAERPYDVAGWTLPMQMGVETTAVLGFREPERERRLTPIRDEAQVRRDLGLAPRQGERSPVASPLRQNVRVGLYKSYTASMDEGWTRYVFDTFNVPFQSVFDRDVHAGNLRSRFDVIVLPSMRLRDLVEGRDDDTAPPEFTRGLGAAGTEALRRFVEEGGTLVCIDAATEFAIKRLNLPVRNALADLKSSEFYCPGSILRLEVDTSHPLARGFGESADAYFVNSAAFDVTDRDRARFVARYAARDVLRSGWLLGEKHLAGKAALVEVSLGRGRVVLFGFRPQHRAQTWGTFPFLFNALEWQ
ncbi:MAG TPA: hypothetical protein VGV38_09990, partial [Pyrinomonadaceae bacterium]|nr:hypothetical protein [Pyrinomonadaceae bacterium]